MEEFRGKVLVELEDRTIDLTLPETATETIRYIAKLCVVSGKGFKLLPVSTLRRKFVRIDDSRIKYAFGSEFDCLEDVLKDEDDVMVSICGSTNVELGSKIDGSKMSICVDGVAYRLEVTKETERVVKSSSNMVRLRRSGVKSEKFYAKSATHHPLKRDVEDVVPYPESARVYREVGIDYGYVMILQRI